MAKLNKKTAAEVEKTDAGSSGFDALPDGEYACRLSNVDDTRSGDKGPYWTWEFTIPEGQPYAGRRFWSITSLSEAARPMLKRMFDAFNVPADTDTDDLIGRMANVKVKTVIQTKGAATGEPKNEVARVTAYDGPDLSERGSDDDIPY